MKITQVFKSAGAEQIIGKIEIAGSTPSAPIPIPGDSVRWATEGVEYTGKVVSRLITYGAPEMSLGRDDDFDITATLTVELNNA